MHGYMKSWVTEDCFISVIEHTVSVGYNCVCVRVLYFCVNYWGRELESVVSPRDVGFWCFPNQRSGTISDEDVMSSSGSLFHANCGHMSCAMLLMLYSCLHFHLCFSVYLSVFFSLCLYLSFVMLKGCRRLLAVFFFSFFMNGMCCLLWQSYFCLCWWWTHTVWPH